MGNELIQNKANTLKKLMESAKKEIEAALPKHVTPERMMRIALTEARKTPKLLECDQASFLGAVIQASQLGLEPGGSLGHCYLIPYGREVNFQVGYRGMIELAMRAEKVSHISARAVHEGDLFEWEYGLNEGLTHKPGNKPGILTHVYCVVHLKNGCKMFDVMNMEEVETIRKSSKAGNNGPWKTHFEEMAKKSVIRRLFKYMPVSVELSTAVTLDELADAGEGQGNSAIINTTGRSVGGVSDLQAQLHGEPVLDGDFAAFEVNAPAAVETK
jgi:recombination protein RecT